MPALTESKRDQLIKRIGGDPTLWRVEAWAAYALVDDELQRVQGRGSGKAHANEVAIIRNDLDDALLAMAPPQRPSDLRQRIARAPMRAWKSLKLYYSGADIERTWSAIHRASESLYMLYDKSELAAMAMRLAKLVAALPDLSSQLTSLTGTEHKSESDSKGLIPKMRAMFRELYREAIGATESLQTEARVLRNTLLAASGALFLVVLAIGVVHAVDHSIVPVCAGKSGAEVCPIGKSPHPFDVFAVELAGMLGGILSVVIPLATGERIKTPYRVFNHQLLLKILAGAAAGLAGVVLVESGLVSAFTVESGTAIIGYAIFFGFSQQALTGIIDRRASDLGKETPTAKSV